MYAGFSLPVPIFESISPALEEQLRKLIRTALSLAIRGFSSAGPCCTFRSVCITHALAVPESTYSSIGVDAASEGLGKPVQCHALQYLLDWRIFVSPFQEFLADPDPLSVLKMSSG